MRFGAHQPPETLGSGDRDVNEDGDAKVRCATPTTMTMSTRLPYEPLALAFMEPLSTRPRAERREAGGRSDVAADAIHLIEANAFQTYSIGGLEPVHTWAPLAVAERMK
jgi:hypothetical protein